MANQHAAEFLAAFDDHLDSDGQEFEHQRTSEGFVAIIEVKPPIDPRLELGSDLREHAIISGRRDVIPDMRHGDVITQLTGLWFTEDTPPQPWKIIKREDNPADIAIKYWIVRIAPEDEQ